VPLPEDVLRPDARPVRRGRADMIRGFSSVVFTP
jgi:hypothetical protein